jgi:hypothetical protein
MIRTRLLLAALGGSMCMGLILSVQAQNGTGQQPQTVTGRQLMTPEERAEHRAKMQSMTPERRQAYREEMHKKMQERAKQMGMSLPENPPQAMGRPWGGPGRGWGPGGPYGYGYPGYGYGGPYGYGYGGSYGPRGWGRMGPGMGPAGMSLGEPQHHAGGCPEGPPCPDESATAPPKP